MANGGSCPRLEELVARDVQQPGIVEQPCGQIGGPEAEIGSAVGEHRAFAVRRHEHDDRARGDVVITCDPGVDAKLFESFPMVSGVRRAYPTRKADRRAQCCEPCGLVGTRTTR